MSVVLVPTPSWRPDVELHVNETAASASFHDLDDDDDDVSSLLSLILLANKFSSSYPWLVFDQSPLLSESGRAQYSSYWSLARCLQRLWRALTLPSQAEFREQNVAACVCAR